MHKGMMNDEDRIGEERTGKIELKEEEKSNGVKN